MAEGYRKDYFSTGADDADRSRHGVFSQVDEVQGFQVADGVFLRPVSGENLMMSFVYMDPNSIAPEHSHSEEQMGTIIDGEYEFEINGVRRMCRKGDVYFIPPNVPHAARTYEKSCLALDVFNPPRAAFTALMEAAKKPDGANG